MKIYKHLDDHIETYLSVFLLLFFFTLSIIQVFMRYVLNESLVWSEELARYAFVWFVYTSASYAVRYQRHVKFNFLVHLLEKISLFYSNILKMVALLLWIGFLIFLDVYSIKLVSAQFATSQVSPANHIPIYLVYLGMPLGALLMTFRVVQHIVVESRELIKNFKTLKLSKR